ncbi:hypothetical protein C9I36_13250 [Pectobacterium punjabense]|nr:hypothetical protein C9I36_13250 [Pectobacterium punjabense]
MLVILPTKTNFPELLKKCCTTARTWFRLFDRQTDIRLINTDTTKRHLMTRVLFNHHHHHHPD